MGQMKKLYEQEAELIERAGVFYMNRMATLQMNCNKSLDLIRKAEFLVGDWLTNQYEHMFGVQDDLETARQCLNEAINLLEGPNDTQGAGIQVRRPHEDGDDPRSGADA